MSSLNSKKLQTLYIAFFGRPCDPSGMNYWLSRMNENVELIDIANSLSKKYNVPIVEIPFPDKLKGQYQEFTQANLEQLEKHFKLDWIDIREYIENE